MAAFSTKEVKNAAEEEREKGSTSLPKDSVNRCKVISTSFREFKGKSMLVGEGEWIKRDCKENWEIIRAQVLKHLSGAGKSERGGTAKDVRRGASAREMIKKSTSIRVIEEKEVRGDDPIKYFSRGGLKYLFNLKQSDDS